MNTTRTTSEKIKECFKNDRFIWEFSSTIGTIGLGALFHFTYEWSNKSPAVAWFSATNESVWEHEKLLYFPSILFTSGMLIYQHACCPTTNALSTLHNMKTQDILFSRIIGLLCALVFIPVIFYIYTLGGQEGKSIPIVDIITFLIAAVLVSVISWFIQKAISPTKWYTFFGIFLAIVLIGLFTIFSYIPPSTTGLFFPYTETH
jgi:cytochrome c biogenesis factor